MAPLNESSGSEERSVNVKALLRSSLARLGPALALVLVVVVFALLTDAPARYLSPFNLRIVLTQTVIVALGAIGMTLIIIGGGIDLSVGATIALTGVVAALAIGAGWPPHWPSSPRCSPADSWGWATACSSRGCGSYRSSR